MSLWCAFSVEAKIEIGPYGHGFLRILLNYVMSLVALLPELWPGVPMSADGTVRPSVACAILTWWLITIDVGPRLYDVLSFTKVRVQLFPVIPHIPCDYHRMIVRR